MDPEIKKLLRTIVRKVHPDLFVSHPRERYTNSESLKVSDQLIDIFIMYLPSPWRQMSEML
jgi:hypothetical protein